LLEITAFSYLQFTIILKEEDMRNQNLRGLEVEDLKEEDMPMV